MVTPVSKTVLVINCGSSSVKFAIMDPNDGHVYLSGIASRKPIFLMLLTVML